MGRCRAAGGAARQAIDVALGRALRAAAARQLRRSMRLTGRAMTGCLLVGVASAALGCGGGTSSTTSPVPPSTPKGATATIDVYSSLPMHGLSRVHSIAIEKGIRLALAQSHSRLGPFTIRYIAL